jgi:hypothetical protein
LIPVGKGFELVGEYWRTVYSFHADVFVHLSTLVVYFPVVLRFIWYWRLNLGWPLI